MKEKTLGKVTIEAEANSPETLEKLLEQALFELKLSSTDDNGTAAWRSSARVQQWTAIAPYKGVHRLGVTMFSSPAHVLDA